MTRLVPVHAPSALALALAAALAGCGVADPERPIGEEKPGTPTSGEALIDASSTTDWAFFSFASAATVTVSDMHMSGAWDVAIRRTQLATNGGSSGMQKGCALAMETTDWDAVQECPADGYQADMMMPASGAPGSAETTGNPTLAAWYSYDPATHAVSSKGMVYCVRAADGRYAKLAVLSYAAGKMTLKWRFQPDGTRSVR